MSAHDPKNKSGEEDAPMRLVEALKRGARRDVFIPPATDNAIIRQTLRHFQHPMHSGEWIRRVTRELWWPLPFPRFALAALVLAVGLAVIVSRFSDHSRHTVAREDIDGNGRVDILDAFALARLIENGTADPAKFDFTGDRIVSKPDVDAIATRAVRLEGGPS